MIVYNLYLICKRILNEISGIQPEFAYSGGSTLLNKNIYLPTILLWVTCLLPLLAMLSLIGYKLKLTMDRERRLSLKSCHKFTNSTDTNHIIVVGSGILGSAMASVLARDGRCVSLIERDFKEPDRIVGELLQPGGCEALKKLGLGECLISCEEAQKTTGYVIHDYKSGSSVHIPYPDHKELPGHSAEGRAFRHGKFINRLRKAAMEETNVTVVEGAVQQLIEDNDVVVGVKYKPKGEDNSKEIHAPLVIIADGGFSKFRKQLHDDRVQVYSHFVGFVMRNCPQIKDYHAELMLADPNPILIYKISDEETRVLVDIRGPVLPKNLKDYLIDKILPCMPDHLSEAFEDGVANERIRYMPCKFLPPSNARKNGVIMLGDAFNMRHPLTGGGMSVAFNDVCIWRELLCDIPDLTDYRAIDTAYSFFQNRRKSSHSFVVNVLAQALYELFSADDDDLARLRDACFEYFKLGGSCVAGPVGLLSVLTPDPLTLIGHFFAVALYSVWLIVRRSGVHLHVGLYKATRTFIKACHILFPLVWTEIRTIA